MLVEGQSRHREFVIATIVIVVAMLAEIAACKPRVLLAGPFWLDECITAQIVTDPGISHSLGAVRHGVDTNPPVFHLIERAAWAIEQSVGVRSLQIGLRLVSVVCAAATLVLLYRLLRRAFLPWPAVAGVAAVWAHPDVVEQATDARFYLPLLLSAVAICWFAGMVHRRWWQQLLLVITSALLCTLHYFGIISLVCVAVATAIVDERPVKSRLIALSPMLAGPIALLPFLPWVHDQAAGLSVKTWLDPLSYFSAKAFVGQVLCPMSLLIITGMFLVTRHQKVVDHRLRRHTYPLFSLAIVPIVIVLFSATVQSALRSRYGITAALAFAPLAAIAASAIDRRMVMGMIVLFVGISVLEMHGNASRRAALAAKLSAERELFADKSKVLFAARSDAVELRTFAPELADQIAILDVADSGAAVRPFRRYENDMARKTAAWYATARIIDSQNPSQLPPGSHYLLVCPPEDLPAILQHHLLVHQSGDIYRLADVVRALQ